MQSFKLMLMSATVLAGTASLAQAQVVYPAEDLHGVGATSIENILVQELNCEGGIDNQLGTNAPALITEPNNATYTGSPTYSCATGNSAGQFFQPNEQGHYIGTGSGGGRSGWETFSRGSGVPTGKNPFDPNATDPTWNHYQFAFTDGPISQTDLTTYEATMAGMASTNNIGNPIQIPMYVLPVALAYNPVYGVNSATNATYSFNVKSTYVQKVNGVVIGGLRMTQANYCAVFNGSITNWNDAALQTSNDKQSLMDPADPRGTAGWASEGVTIRLVGRSDSSGTTTIFTRHLAAICGADVDAGGTNKFQESGNGLPYDAAPNLTNVDSTSYYAGTTNSIGNNGHYGNITNDAAHESISGAYFDKTMNAIVTTDGSETAGLFMVAEGSDGVADAINLAPDRVSSLDSSLKLNGKFGYVSADFILPVAGATLYSVALPEISKPTVFLVPNAKNAAAALTELPPQTTATSGVWNTADTRVVFNPHTGATETVDRANPLHWTAVLYPYASGATVQGLTGLAMPATGYPITGTTQLVTYTCFATTAAREALSNLIAVLTGKAPKQAITINAGLYSSTSATAPGITAQLGASPMPGAWNTAIEQTFLTDSTEVSGGGKLGTIKVAYDSTREGYYTTATTGGTGLQMSQAIPTTTVTLAKDLPNTQCTSGQGA